ncbi:MAG TPA: hypothetical protein VK866_11760 [Acidimicrobiales bacterium]|nr:hypothetical protein [Acidimicrobiales bacterium]
MAEVTVEPAEFRNVFFDAAEISRIVGSLCDDIGLEAPVRLEVDESTPLGRVDLVSLDPVTVAVQSGALEDKKHPRHLGERETADNLGRTLVKVTDRLSPEFGDPPPVGEEIPLALYVAWDTYAMGRLARLGYYAQRQRRLYAFQLRHGFTDAATAAFDQLWAADSLTWADIVALSDQARAGADAA